MNIPLLKAIVILPGTALVYIPSAIVWFTRTTVYAAKFPPDSTGVWVAGILFALAALILIVWTVRLFTTEGGGGTPAPWNPIRNFIVRGPYLYVRNPMLIGVILFLVAESILLQSIPVFLWAAVFVLINTVYFSVFEEPQLEKRFGQEYVDYKRCVSRWIPRLTSYNRDNEARRP